MAWCIVSLPEHLRRSSLTMKPRRLRMMTGSKTWQAELLAKSSHALALDEPIACSPHLPPDSHRYVHQVRRL